MDHAAKIYDLVKLSFTTASTRVRIIYDKGYHGGNRAKDSKLSDEERSLARRCILCGQDDSQDHWLHFCTHSTLASLRQTILIELNSKVTAYRSLSTIHRQLSTAFKSLLMETDEPARIWTANWSHKQITSFCRLVNPQGLEGLKMRNLKKILEPLESILAHGAISLWRCKQVQEKLRLPSYPARKQKKSCNHRDTPSRGDARLSLTPSLPRRRTIAQPLLTLEPSHISTCLRLPKLTDKE